MYLKSLLKLVFVFILNLIKRNPVKLVFLIVLAISFSKAGTYPDTKVSYSIIDSLCVKEPDNKKCYLYIVNSYSDGNIKYEILKSDTPIKVIKGIYSNMEYAGFNIFLWVLVGLSSFLLLVCFFIGIGGDDQVEWEFKDVWRESFNSLVICVEEDGKYYYMCFGRLIKMNDTLLSNYNSKYNLFGLNGFSDLHIYPKFETRQSKRNRHLNKLGV